MTCPFIPSNMTHRRGIFDTVAMRCKFNHHHSYTIRIDNGIVNCDKKYIGTLPAAEWCHPPSIPNDLQLRMSPTDNIQLSRTFVIHYVWKTWCTDKCIKSIKTFTQNSHSFDFFAAAAAVFFFSYSRIKHLLLLRCRSSNWLALTNFLIIENRYLIVI